jgi:hypothetical protein
MIEIAACVSVVFQAVAPQKDDKSRYLRMEGMSGMNGLDLDYM